MSSWIYGPVKALDESAREAAVLRQQQLTKPLGSLGRLENVAIELAAMQGKVPTISAPFICIFAADHGIAAAGVSAFPQEVTGQMVANFASGGAAISVLAKSLLAPFEIVNLGTVSSTDFPGVQNAFIAAGTANMLETAAMTSEQCAKALKAGRTSLLHAKSHGCELFIGGDMGIGNTTSATVLAAAITGESVAELTGPGTGLDESGIARKIDIIEQVIARHVEPGLEPLTLLSRVGGFEIAALVGSYISAAQQGITILVDGFICTAAAMVAVAIAPESRNWMLFAHSSAEPGHRLMLKHLQAKPLLDLQMRLGEGSGAAICVPLLQMACKLHAQMATFAEAAVAGKLDEE
ncbi:MAG: nicotinate-nucleotide--dimethylbenzimidazole phosphoribosyltransferase [Pseudomonadales bacterium]|nr:nicotinate-nucleotide--dimethylbenzimidazole phosphoribosyltransferase [Pseudomonadales bacterium]